MKILSILTGISLLFCCNLSLFAQSRTSTSTDTLLVSLPTGEQLKIIGAGRNNTAVLSSLDFNALFEELNDSSSVQHLKLRKIPKFAPVNPMLTGVFPDSNYYVTILNKTKETLKSSLATLKSLEASNRRINQQLKQRGIINPEKYSYSTTIDESLINQHLKGNNRNEIFSDLSKVSSQIALLSVKNLNGNRALYQAKRKTAKTQNDLLNIDQERAKADEEIAEAEQKIAEADQKIEQAEREISQRMGAYSNLDFMEFDKIFNQMNQQMQLAQPNASAFVQMQHHFGKEWYEATNNTFEAQNGLAMTIIEMQDKLMFQKDFSENEKKQLAYDLVAARTELAKMNPILSDKKVYIKDGGKILAKDDVGEIVLTYPPKNKKFPNWSTSIDFGFSNWISNGTIVGDKNEPYTLSTQGSRYFAIRTMRNAKIYKNHQWAAGLEASWYNYMFQKPVQPEQTDNGLQFVDKQDLNYQSVLKNKLTVFYLNIPLMIQLVQDNKFSAGIGGYVGYRLDAYTKMKFEKDNQTFKTHTHDSFYTNPVQYGVRAEAGYGGASLFVKYTLSKVFQNSAGEGLNNVSPFTVGISF